MLNKSVVQYLNDIESVIDRNHALLFLIKCREEIDWEYPISDEIVSKLTRDNIVGRNYIDRSFKLLIPFYQDDIELFNETNIMINNQLLQVGDRIDEYRTLFRGYRVGNMGNRKNCIESLNRFIYTYKIEFDEILYATQYYIQSTDPKYITNAENFIYKITDKGEVSKLYDIIEELRLMRIESNML